MKMREMIVGLGAAAALCGFASADILHDNGTMDGINGLSHLSGPGQRRSILDDFQISAGQWTINHFATKFAWMDGSVGTGTGIELIIYGDNAGVPDLGNVIAVANTSNYQEAADPSNPEFFGLTVADVSVDTADIILGEGRYWIDMHVVGPVNGMQPTTNTGNGNAWLNYEDFGGLMRIEDVFGTSHDAVFTVSGMESVPAPGALALLGLAGICGTRRRKA